MKISFSSLQNLTYDRNKRVLGINRDWYAELVGIYAFSVDLRVIYILHFNFIKVCAMSYAEKVWLQRWIWIWTQLSSGLTQYYDNLWTPENTKL